MLSFQKGEINAFVRVVKSGSKVCFCRFFGESARTLVRAALGNVAVHRLGLGFRLGDVVFDV